MKLKYIKADGKYYKPQIAGVKDKKSNCNYPVCTIKKLLFGRWRIDYYDEEIQYNELGGYAWGDEDKPNARIILYPSSIEVIKWMY